MKDKLGERMKGYENITDFTLPEDTEYFILRLDGIKFHSFINQLFAYPYDQRLRDALIECAKMLLRRYSGALLGFVQSDEISLLFKVMRNDTHLANARVPLYCNRIQRIISVAAGLVSGFFNKILFREGISTVEIPHGLEPPYNLNIPNQVIGFDCRCFPIPIYEINNYLIWRQKDAWRNTTTSVFIDTLYNEGNISKALINKIMHEMNSTMKWAYLYTHYGKSHMHYPDEFKLGTVITNQKVERKIDTSIIIRYKFLKNKKTPDFVNDKDFVEDLLQ